jgi:hypothetical protein
MHCILTIPEIVENIFAFLSRKKLYNGCTRVNRQWNAVATFIIQKKRKNELINITNIRDNIFHHLYFNDAYNIDFVNYCVVNKIWETKFKELDEKYNYFTSLERSNNFFLINGNSYIIKRRWLIYERSSLVQMQRNSPKFIKYDQYLKRCYQYIISQYDIRIEFLRLAKSFCIYDTLYSTQKEFHRITRVFRSIY